MERGGKMPTGQKVNKVSAAAARKRWREKYPNRSRTCYLRSAFGITAEEYDSMLEAQLGLCAICGRPERSKKNNSSELRRLAVDHDHMTGKVRALLCHHCNLAIGSLDDDHMIVLKAYQYLLLHKEG